VVPTAKSSGDGVDDRDRVAFLEGKAELVV
jgi:hypothetical protein